VAQVDLIQSLPPLLLLAAVAQQLIPLAQGLQGITEDLVVVAAGQKLALQAEAQVISHLYRRPKEIQVVLAALPLLCGLLVEEAAVRVVLVSTQLLEVLLVLVAQVQRPLSLVLL
jgi:uncharacterized membrane protein YgcG